MLNNRMSHHHHPKTSLKFSARNQDLRDLLPFPNFFIHQEELPVICKCVYDGTKFYVLNTKDILTLYNDGAFGKSKLTHRAPVADQNDDMYKRQAYFKKIALASENLIIQSNYKVPVNTVVLCPNDSDSMTLTASTSKTDKPQGPATIPPTDLIKKDSIHNVNNGKDKQTEPNSLNAAELKKNSLGSDVNHHSAQKSDSSKPDLSSKNPLKRVYEKTIDTQPSSSSPVPAQNNYEEDMLLLLPEEVIFLSFGVGCLSTQDLAGQTLSYQTLWETLVAKNTDFPYLYAVYHYFRCKNWVPKLGHSFGGDYVLYEYGPKFSHALYVVHIFGSPKRAQPTWMEIYSRQRTALHSSKLALICNVTTPDKFVPSTPMSIFQLKIEEMTVHRWTP